MNCQQYAKSRMLVEYDGHPPQATCSLHCAAVELAFATNRRLKSIQVGDFVTTEMINAENAHWVIGGSKPGVMTKTGTWAFNQRKDAETFVQENGGKIGDFAEALDAIYVDIKSNIKTISQKR
jgi:nitrous oxide reductase accessory protein NosL